MTYMPLILGQSIPPHADVLIEAYSKGLRTAIFTGFFTLAGLSFAIGSFLWVQVKNGVYDRSDYQDRVRALRAFNPKLSAVGPLFRFMYHVLATGTFLLIAAVLQVTLGFFESRTAVLTCLATAAVAVLSLMITIVLAVRNAVVWHGYAEQAATANVKSKSAAVT